MWNITRRMATDRDELHRFCNSRDQPESTVLVDAIPDLCGSDDQYLL